MSTKYKAIPTGLFSVYYHSLPLGGVGGDSLFYTLTDHLGTPKTITNVSGAVVYEQNFDAWGQRRNANTWDYSSITSPPNWLYRGFTGHEHLPQFSLINMNGRMYDPQNARMLSVDPILQDPTNSQNHNKYSYALNNPLKYTDPSGYDFKNWFKENALPGQYGGGTIGSTAVDLNNNLNGKGWSGIAMHQNAPIFGDGLGAQYENYEAQQKEYNDAIAFGDIYGATYSHTDNYYMQSALTQEMILTRSEVHYTRRNFLLNKYGANNNNQKNNFVENNYIAGAAHTSTVPTKSSIGLDGWEHTAGPVLGYLGDNNIATRAKFKGATPGTSLASKTLSKIFPQKLTKVLGNKIGTKVATNIGTNTIGRALGRFVPFVGWTLTVYDFNSFLFEHKAEIQRGMEERNRLIQEGVIPFR